jgi:hypothetical protein
MAQVETQAQMEDFLNQLDPEGRMSTWFGPQFKQGPLGSIKERVRQVIMELLTIERSASGKKRLQLIEVLTPEADSQGSRRLRHRWWLGRAAWMAFILAAGFSLSWVATWITRAPWTELLEFNIAVWAVVTGALLESVKSLYEKREQANVSGWMMAGETRIDDLVRKDRNKADQLVRQQCGRELAQCAEILNDVRSRAFRAGQENQALELRGLEKKFTIQRERVLRPDFGRPPYVSGLKVSSLAWDTMLDYDEDLLVNAVALVDAAALIQQEFSNNSWSDGQLSNLERELDLFINRFAGRTRALRPQAAVSQPA